MSESERDSSIYLRWFWIGFAAWFLFGIIGTLTTHNALAASLVGLAGGAGTMFVGSWIERNVKTI